MCNFLIAQHSAPENCVASCFLEVAFVAFTQIHEVVLQSPPFFSLAEEMALVSSSAGLQPLSHLPLPRYKAQDHGDCRTTCCLWGQTTGGNKWSNCHVSSLMAVASPLQSQKCCGQVRRSPTNSGGSCIWTFLCLQPSDQLLGQGLDVIQRKCQWNSIAPVGQVLAWKSGSVAPSFFSLLSYVLEWIFISGFYLSYLFEAQISEVFWYVRQLCLRIVEFPEARILLASYWRLSTWCNVELCGWTKLVLREPTCSPEAACLC